MGRALIVAGAALIAAALALGAILFWRLQEGAVGPEDGESAYVVVHFNWVLAMGATGLVLVTIGLLSRMRRRRRPRL